MCIEVERHIVAARRSVSALEVDAKPARAVTLRRIFNTNVDVLWDTVTNPERLPLWFLPVSGDLCLGGRFQLEGNAAGSIQACERPSRLALTWEFAGDTSWVDVWISKEDAGRTQVQLTHTVHASAHWDQYGSAATGVGWELGLLGLALLLEHPEEPRLDAEAFAASTEGKVFVARSSDGWAQASIEAGEERSASLAAAARTAAFYTATS